MLNGPRRATDIPPYKAPFRLQAIWFLHLKFEKFLHKCWTEDEVDDLGKKLKCLRESLQYWNRTMLENLFDRKFCYFWHA